MPDIQVQTEDWLAPYSDEPEKVREFCARHGVLDHLRTTLELVKRYFPPIKELKVRLWRDPLEGTEKARVYVTVRGSVEEALERDRRFLVEWTEAVPYTEQLGFTYTAG